jgi:histidyl-tRNA synthetase
LALHHLQPELKPLVDLVVAPIIDSNTREGATLAASKLRPMGLNVAVDYTGRKLIDQLKAVQKKKIRFVLIVGSKEVETQKFTLRDLDESIEYILTLKQVAEKIKALINV